MLDEFITVHKAEIIEHCLGQLRQNSPDRSDAELLNSIPAFLDDLVEALEHDRRPLMQNDDSPPSDMMREHGSLRKQQGFDVHRLVFDFGTICDSVNSLLSQNGETATPQENLILNQWVDRGIALALDSYLKETQAEDERQHATKIGVLAHEIRNAVSNAVTGFNLIQEGKAPLKGGVASAVQRALHRITELVTDSMASAQTAHSASLQEAVDIKRVLSDISLLATNDRGVRVHLDVPEGLSVRGNSALLASAIGNLVQNAVKFTRENESVWVRAHREDGFVAVEVEDRCGGLPEEKISELFQPFVQGVADGRGAGLGLSIASRAVRAHRGSLNVRNIPGVGCAFTVRLVRI